MALYAFDGTGNSDEGPVEDDTNVVRFREVYAGADFEYIAGVGTRLGAVGKVVGGLFGAGGRSRIEEMYEALCENFSNNDTDIDIVGYSRGAALATHFANKIATQGIDGHSGSEPTIRFLGLFDQVASFGLSFNNVLEFQEMNLFWNVENIPKNVQHCFHAMAMDERREAFTVTRLKKKSAKTNLTEIWFRGVHGDVGGGNRNTARSNIALQWMLDAAVQVGLPINERRRQEARYAFDENQLAPISENKDLKIDDRRKVRMGDEFHSSVDAKLRVGETRHCRVLAGQQYNWSGVTLESGAQYEVSLAPNQAWEDGGITCGPTGWETKDLPWIKEKFVKFFEDNRRSADNNWFALMAAMGDEDKHSVLIGNGATLQPIDQHDLYFYANDLRARYENNSGSIDVVTTRTA